MTAAGVLLAAAGVLHADQPSLEDALEVVDVFLAEEEVVEELLVLHADQDAGSVLDDEVDVFLAGVVVVVDDDDQASQVLSRL